MVEVGTFKMIRLGTTHYADQVDASLASGAIIISGATLVMSNGILWDKVGGQ